MITILSCNDRPTEHAYAHCSLGSLNEQENRKKQQQQYRTASHCQSSIWQIHQRINHPSIVTVYSAENESMHHTHKYKATMLKHRRRLASEKKNIWIHQIVFTRFLPLTCCVPLKMNWENSNDLWLKRGRRSRRSFFFSSLHIGVAIRLLLFLRSATGSQRRRYL